MLFDPYAYDLATSAQGPLPGAGARATNGSENAGAQHPQAPAAEGAALAAETLLEVPTEARATLWQGLMDAVGGALDLWEQTPPGARREPPSFPVQHAGKPRFNPDDLRCQTLAGWHRLAGIELLMATQALEALALVDAPIYREKLAEQCARMGQLYDELKRRAGEWVALALLRWELRLLCYRASPTLASLIYD